MKKKMFVLPFLSNKKIQVHIVTIFFIIFTCSSFLMTRYTYTQYYKDIHDLSYRAINQVNALLLEKITGVKQQIELVAEILKGSVQDDLELTGQDPRYIDFLINVIKKDPFLTAITLVKPNGEYFSVMGPDFAEISRFYSHPSDVLPKGASYVIRTIHKKESSFEEIWRYENDRGDVLATEIVKPPSYDFSQSPWLSGVMKSPGVNWNIDLLPRGTEKYKSERMEGIVISEGIEDALGNTVAALEISITLKKLSEFMAVQKVGKSGAAFIIDETGRIRVPLEYEAFTNPLISQSMISAGYEEFKKTSEKGFSVSWNGKSYLFSVLTAFDFPGQKWFVVSVVPYNDFFEETIKTQRRTRGFSLLMIIICAVVTYFSSKYISGPIVVLAKEVDKIRDFDFTQTSHVESQIKEIIELEHSISNMRVALHSFSRYIPKDIVRSLIKQGIDVKLGGERRLITLLFSDVRNFTTISESLPIEELMAILSDYFDVLSKAVLEQNGTIDKYIGDSLMAFWNAPEKIIDHEQRACIACLQCLALIKRENKWVTRFGIHAGEVIVGNIGTSERINYTAIGDAVNVASRLESINKEYGTFAMISEVVRKEIGPKFVTRPIDNVAVKGKTDKLKIYELMGMTEGLLAASSEQKELAFVFTEAYKAMEEGRSEEAYNRFIEIAKRFPSDIPTKKYIERLKKA